MFPDRVVWGYVFPAAGFALWHLASQQVFPSKRPGGPLMFVASAWLLGLLFGWVPWRTGSIRYSSASHFLMDYSGLGANYYFIKNHLAK